MSKQLRIHGAEQASHSLRFSAFPAIAFRRLLEITVALDVSNQSLFLAHLLKPLDHLLDTFARSRLDLNHKKSNLPFN